MYEGVPIAVPMRVASMPDPASRMRATPKSRTFTFGVLGDEDVPGLDVAMDDADLVTLREEVEHGLEDPQRLLERDLAAGPMAELVERPALEQVHDEERLAGDR